MSSSPATPLKPFQPSAPRRSRVMLVEDETIVALDLERRLTNLGFTVVATASDGREAVHQAAETSPDLILMDINLGPGMSGIEAAGLIQARHEVAIIFVTANSDRATMEEAARSDPSGYVLKPFEDRELVTAIQMGMARYDMEQRLKESERRFAAAIKAVGEGLMATDARGLITFFNPSAEKITGWRLQEAVGRTLAEVFPLFDDGTHQPDTDFFSKFLIPGVGSDALRTAMLRCRDATEIPVEYRAAHIENDFQKLAGVAISFRDITERRWSEARIRQAQEDLAQSHAQLVAKHEELQTFYHTVAHEVKTPLTSAREFVSLVLEGLAGPMTPTQTEYLKIAQESCDQMRTCINDMLDVTRLQTGKLSVDLKRGALGAVVQRVVTMLTPAAEQKSIQLTCAVDPNLPEIQMDETRIAQVVANLLNNALKFTPEKGRILAGVARGQPGFIEIKVADTGRGIPKEHVDRIFDRLYQVRTDDAASCNGLGLGLHICKELTGLHGGDIRLESQEGRGTTFYVALPISPTGKLSVLVVSDGLVLTDTRRGMLEREGFSVAVARHGKEALLRIAEHVPDLVVTDLVMPEMDGMELLQRIREHWAQLPVILQTPFPDSALMIGALEYSPFTLLSNDCDQARFLRTVQDLTRAARGRAENEVRTRTRQPAPAVGPPSALSAA